MKLPKKSDALVGEDKSLEDDDENFLNPEDLSIIDEKTWEPSDEEILSYALKLGYNIEKDPDELFEVAYYYMKYPLPEGWKRAIYKKTKELMYINMEDGEIEVATEIEEMAHQMYLEKKEEMLLKKSGDKGVGTGIGNDENKIPPINDKKSQSILPPVKEKNGSKNSLFNELEKELDKNKEKEKSAKKDKNITLLEKSNSKKEIEEIIDKDKERKKNNDDIFGISSKPFMSNNVIKEDTKENMKESEENDKEKNLYGIHAEESEEEKEYGEDFDFDGLEDDSEGRKGEPLIKSIINKEKEKEKEKKEEKEKLEKEKIEKEKIEKDKKEKELKEKQLREEKEKKEKLKLELEKEKEKEFNNNLEKEKKEYLNKKLKELQLYKEEKKKKYEQSKKALKSKESKLKEEYELKYEKELKNKKQKLQSQYNQKLEFYEAQLINKKLTEEKKYREDKEYTYKEKQKDLKRKKEREIEEKNSKLQEKKSRLLKNIKEECLEKEKQESNYKEKKIKIQNNIKLLEEKKKIDLINLDKKLDLSIKDYEINSEKKFLKEKEQMKESFHSQSSNNILNYNGNNSSSSNLNFSISGINNDENNDFIKSKIMENIQKAMDEEYEITCRSIEQELINNKMKEIEKYKSSLTKEKEDKLKNIENDITSVEKEYYKSIAEIRQNSQNKKIEGDKYINTGFEQTLKQNEDTKNKISKDNKKLMELFLEGIQKLISKNNTLEQTEIQIEEFLMQLKDNYHMTLQKNKNTYEIAEYDYKQKKVFIKYLLDVINYLGKIFSSSNADIFEIDNKTISENLLKFCKEKINSNKLKFQNKKKKRIFNFLNESLLGNNSFLNLSEFEDTRDSSAVFVNSFKRKSENDINNNAVKESIKNDNINFINRINVDESINNINKNSFIFKNNLAESMNNLKKFNNTFYNFNNNNGINNNNLFRTQSQNDYNINEGFFKMLNQEKENENVKLDYYTLEQNKNYMIPLIPEKILDNIDEKILNSYSEIVLFLKNEYLKLIEIEKNENLNNNAKNKKINIRLNLLILDKIKIYVEEAFTYIINNYYKKEKALYIEKKIQLVKKHINDFNINFNVDKYLKNPDSYKNFAKKNNYTNINGQNYYKNEGNNFNKQENNGMNNLILNGKFKGQK